MPLFVSFRAISSSVSTDSTMCGSISVAGVLFILVYVFESDSSHELEGAFRHCCDSQAACKGAPIRSLIVNPLNSSVEFSVSALLSDIVI